MMPNTHPEVAAALALLFERWRQCFQDGKFLAKGGEQSKH
jgi:hypothetical protein